MTLSGKDFDYTQLAPAQRILLAQDLWDSVLRDGAAPATTPDQRAEIERRIVLAEAGRMPSSPWPEAKTRLTPASSPVPSRTTACPRPVKPR
jgi:putative addiction module component (TIGR02574 family)